MDPQVGCRDGFGPNKLSIQKCSETYSQDLRNVYDKLEVLLEYLTILKGGWKMDILTSVCLQGIKRPLRYVVRRLGPKFGSLGLRSPHGN